MASRNSMRCVVGLVRNTVTQGIRRAKIDGVSKSSCLGSQRLFSKQSNSILVSNSLVKNSLRSYTVVSASSTAVHFQAAASSLNLLANVDVRSVTNGATSSLSEAGTEDDDEQNCPHNSGIIHRVQDEMVKSETSGQIFAVVHIGGSQFKITVNDSIIINRIDAETGDRIRIEKVLLVGGENFTVIGTPLLARDLVRIEATVMEKTKSPKVIVFKKKRRKGYKRTQGHRQDITVLRINCIEVQPPLLSSSV